MTDIPPLIILLTFRFHSNEQAFLKPAKLAPVAMVFVDWAVLVAAATVAQAFPDAALEETLTALTADGPIMPTLMET